MAEIEQTIAKNVADELDASEAPTAQPGMTDLHGGPGTTAGLNYAPGMDAQGGGGVVGQHEGGGTRPLAGYPVAPTGGAESADTEQAREAAFRATVAQLRIDRAIADESLRRFHRDPVVSNGFVEGLNHLQALQDLERNEK